MVHGWGGWDGCCMSGPSPSAKAAAASLACNSIWTRQRLRGKGLLVDGLCSKCEECLDTIHHKLYHCAQSTKNGWK